MRGCRACELHCELFCWSDLFAFLVRLLAESSATSAAYIRARHTRAHRDTQLRAAGVTLQCAELNVGCCAELRGVLPVACCSTHCMLLLHCSRTGASSTIALVAHAPSEAQSAAARTDSHACRHTGKGGPHSPPVLPGAHVGAMRGRGGAGGTGHARWVCSSSETMLTHSPSPGLASRGRTRTYSSL